MKTDPLKTLGAAARFFKGVVRRPRFKASYVELNDDGILGRVRYFDGTRDTDLWRQETQVRVSWTRLHFNWRPRGVIRVIPATSYVGVRKLVGAQDISIGDRAFDKRFVIQGNPEKWVRSVLDSAVRRHLNLLFDLGGGSEGAHLEGGPAGLTLMCYRNLATHERPLLLFISKGIEILRRFRELAGERAQFVSVQEIVEEGRCPVCGYALQSNLRRCEQCKTLHHQDCWDYFGGCAIYACDGARRKRAPGR